ncbi:MAG: CIA30 family protein [Flavimaricola sp.]|nr:CIA30 family protein [Flavimaricola sp.]
MTNAPALIDDMSLPHPLTPRGTRWEMLSDGVMGGLSQGRMTRADVAGQPALRLEGEVSLANNGGFLQLALDLEPDGRPFDASGWSAIAFDACGPAQTYNLHLRTNAVTRPWQSYRHSFDVGPEWQRITLPFAGFEAHRLDAPFDPKTLRRIGFVAIGRAFHADLATRSIRLV